MVEEVVVNTKNIEGKASEIIKNIAMDIFSKSQENIIKNKSVDTGELLKSGNIWKEDISWIIHYSAPYSVWVEYGTHPHRMPIEPLRRWANRKLGLKGKELNKSVWAIWNKIAREGTDPKPFLRPAIRETMRKYKMSYTEK